jgi:hypothetical protein
MVVPGENAGIVVEGRFLTPNLLSKLPIYSTGTNFLINKVKNRGKVFNYFLFTWYQHGRKFAQGTWPITHAFLRFVRQDESHCSTLPHLKFLVFGRHLRVPGWWHFSWLSGLFFATFLAASFFLWTRYTSVTFQSLDPTWEASPSLGSRPY